MNIDKMLEVSQISDNIKLREKCVKNYEKSYKSGLIFTILAIVVFIVIAYYLKIDLKFVIPLLIIFPCILIFHIKKIKQSSDNIKNNNEPLMFFESEILKLYVVRIARNHVNPRRYYMDLKEPQITLDITEEQYAEFMKNDIRKVRVYFIEELLRNFNSFEIEVIDSGNDIYIEDEVKDKNFDKMIKQSVIVDDLKKRENYLNLYKRISEFTVSSVLVRVFVYLILGIYCSFYFQKKLMFFIIVIPLFILIDKVFGRFFDFRIGLRKKVEEISKNNSPLLCFESRILKLDIRREMYVHIAHRRSYEGWKTVNCMVLSDGIEFKISENEYEKIKAKNIERVKIYFFEELLEPTPYYRIEFDE